MNTITWHLGKKNSYLFLRSRVSKKNIIVGVFVEKRESIASKERPNLIIESGKEIAWYKGNITMKASVIPSCQPMHLSFSHPAPTLDKWQIYLRPSVHPWACCS